MEALVRDEAGKVLLAQPDEIPRRDRDDAMGAYLMMFGSWAVGLPLPIISAIIAGVYHSINGKRSRFVAFNSYQSMLTEFVMSAVNTAMIAWWIILMALHGRFPVAFWAALVFACVWNVAYAVYSIIGAVRSYKGRFFYFPFFGRIAFERYYGESAILPRGDLPLAERNEPPPGY